MINDKTVLQLAMRLNEILKESNGLELKLMTLDKEYNEIVSELWERIPCLRNDVNIQPKKMVKEKK